MRRSLTLIEVTVSATILAMLVVAMGSMVQSATETSSLVSEQTRAQSDAERLLRAVKDQLSRSGYGPQGNLVYTPNPATNTWEIAYNKMNTDPITDPLVPANLGTLWETTRWVIKWEHPTDSASGAGIGVDNDGDYIIDDGRLALYRRTATDQLVAVLGDNIRNFVVTQQVGTPQTQARIRLQVTAERVLVAAVKGANDAAAVRAGAGPRVRHTADLWVVIPN